MSAGSLSGTVQAVGYSGKGVFIQSGGTNSTTDDMYIGSSTGGTGSYSLNGNGLLLVSNTLTVGDSSSSSGTISLSQNSRLSAKAEEIGNLGTGTFTQSGGTNLCISFGINIGSLGAAGTYNLDGGLLAFSRPIQFGRNAAFNFNGGTLQASGSFSAALPMTLGASGGGATIDTAGYAVTLSAPLSGSGRLTKVGTGALTLTGSNTYSGETAINQGNLIVTGSLASPVTVASGGVLSGTGSLTSVAVNAGGQLAPGGGAQGVLQLSGTLSLLPGAVLDYELRARQRAI